MTDQSTKSLRIVKSTGKWVVTATGALYGETDKALELLEDGHAPVIYFPREDVAMAFFDASGKTTHCPLKGTATYYSIDTKSRILENVAWSYEDPNEGADAIRGHIAFHDALVTVEEH